MCHTYILYLFFTFGNAFPNMSRPNTALFWFLVPTATTSMTWWSTSTTWHTDPSFPTPCPVPSISKCLSQCRIFYKWPCELSNQVLLFFFLQLCMFVMSLSSFVNSLTAQFFAMSPFEPWTTPDKVERVRHPTFGSNVEVGWNEMKQPLILISVY